jgi:predicted RNase H-like nuclease
VYPYTALVGAPEFGYDRERPLYKRKPKLMPLTVWRPVRAANCDELVRRLMTLRNADPPLDLMSHPTTRKLADASPIDDRQYKHREDLIDAAVCAWTGLLWLRRGMDRSQVLGADDAGTPPATIIAPARPEQREPLHS